MVKFSTEYSYTGYNESEPGKMQTQAVSEGETFKDDRELLKKTNKKKGPQGVPRIQQPHNTTYHTCIPNFSDLSVCKYHAHCYDLEQELSNPQNQTTSTHTHKNSVKTFVMGTFDIILAIPTFHNRKL